tara:strand:- start:122 stop:802 length:681 start_codon:yes stop_codon:yes gene_type:complete
MKDSRLDLGRYIKNPFNRRGHIPKRLDFNDLFVSKASEGEYPWNPSRFTEVDLLKKYQTRKQTLNPDLNFVGNSPFFDADDIKTLATNEYEMFEGLGRFKRPFDYDFDEGRARTKRRPQEQPDFNPEWVEAYRFSPTISPGGFAKNPMPRTKNPDPKGYLMAQAEQRAESDIENELSVSDLLARGNRIVDEQKAAQNKTEKKEEKEGAEVITEAETTPDKIEGKEK